MMEQTKAFFALPLEEKKKSSKGMSETEWFISRVTEYQK
jgi:isopenicillin N synthase-like dioxygenase